MPAFAYKAMAADGAGRTGVSQAPDVHAAAGALRAEGLLILEIREVSLRGVGGLWRRLRSAEVRTPRLIESLRPVSRRDIVRFFRQMAMMLRSGLPLLHATEVFRDQCSNPRLARAVGRIASRLLAGESLSAALAQEPRLFSPLAVRMIATGEVTGELDTILERLAAQIEQDAELRNSLMTSLTYPALVVVITVGVVTFLVTSVIPKFMHFLESRNAALPATTQLLMDITTFLNTYGPWIGAALLAVLLAVAGLATTRRGRYAIDRTVLSIPLLGRLLTLAFVAHFGRTLALLLRSGVQVMDGLKILGESVANKAFAAEIQKAEAAVLRGQPLSQGLRARIIPSILPELVSTGEVAGTLDTVLEELGVYHEQRLQREIKWMATLIEPAVILIVGSVVGFVYIAFFQALYQMSSAGQ
jgi:type IV pilus assembly protein PilC